MQQINTLERTFTVLTYFLSAKDFYDVDIQKSCHELDIASANIDKVVLQANEDKTKLDVIEKSLSNIDYNYKVAEQQVSTQRQPYQCVDSSIGKYFCEDNRYSKNLILIGRGQKSPSHDLYKKYFNGIPCDKTCLGNGTDFFIGWNEFTNLYRKKAYGLLIVYIDTADMEHFLYISDVSLEGKKIKFTQSRSSMLNFTVNELVANKSMKDVNITNWKIFLKTKD